MTSATPLLRPSRFDAFQAALLDVLTPAPERRAEWSPSYRPEPKQRAFHESGANYLLYGGAAGGGKTRAMYEDAVRFCRDHAGVVVGYYRRTYPELEDEVIWEFLRVVPPEWYTWNATKHVAQFDNGSVLRFRHCQHEINVHRQRAQYDRLYFDELTHFTELMFDTLCGRLRTTRRDVRPQVRCSTNPGGVGHEWVRARWVDRDPGRVPPQVALADYDFIPAKLVDNPYLDQGYAARLAANADPDLVRALLEGDWDLFAGQFFKGWRAALHIVEPFDIPATWQRFRAYDHGETAPACCLWGAVDPAADPLRLVVYREHYEAGEGLRHHCQAIEQLSTGERYQGDVADPSIFGGQKSDHGTIADQAAALGLRWRAATNDRLGGWTLVKQMLEPLGDGRPALLVFSTCRHLIRTLPAMVHDPHHPEDMRKSGMEDHALDALRYLVMEAAQRGRGGGATGAGPTTRQVAQRSRWAEGV